MLVLYLHGHIRLLYTIGPLFPLPCFLCLFIINAILMLQLRLRVSVTSRQDFADIPGAPKL